MLAASRGLVLGGLGAGALAWVTLAIMVIALAIIVSARRHAFPPAVPR